MAKPITSERLLIRPFKLSDLFAYHSLLSQPEPKAFGIMGGLNPSNDLDSSLSSFAQMLSAWEDGIFYAIFLKTRDDKEDTFIGKLYIMGGFWPHISYMLKKEFWGQGYGTEAVKAFSQFWWNLPRVQKTYYRANPEDVVKNTQIFSRDPDQALEILRATIEPANIASRKVLEKAGFEKYGGENVGMGIKYIKYRLLRPQHSIKSLRDLIKEGQIR